MLNANAKNFINENEFNTLMDNITRLLEEYDYVYNDSAVAKIINTWAVNNGDLINHFKKHPHYVEGKFIIAFQNDFSREIDISKVNQFAIWLTRDSVLEVMREYCPQDIKDRAKEQNCVWLPYDMWSITRDLSEYAEQFISEETETKLNRIFPFAHAHKGQKTSRVFNKILTHLGYAKHPEYNREYAKFADALSPLKITRHTVLSINPMDYLTMSFGNSWASCHTIDKGNLRGMPNAYHGMYSSGTISYMLDSTSMVFYTVEANYDGTDYWTQPKVNRQMFHWGEEKLIQGRLYPQDNDGNAAGYTPFRNIVQSIMATIYDMPNLWVVKKGISEACRFINSRGTHYRDYANFENCNVSLPKDWTNDNEITVGHDPICIECGYEHHSSDSINCCTSNFKCSDCGCNIEDEEDVIWIDGNAYCRDCVNYCDYCQEYTRGDVTDVDPNGFGYFVCDDCLDEYYDTCEECGRWYRRDDLYYVEDEDIYVCRDCRDDYFTRCGECGALYRNDNVRFVESESTAICDSCLEEWFEECVDCGDYVRRVDAYFDEDNNPRCYNCNNEHVSGEEEAM